jgi:cell fate (sporulation/competence/biofilm development) regulator YlbF (YheA/YmcA/DUF963 family)
MLKPKKQIISDKSAQKFLDTIARIKKQRKEKKRKGSNNHMVNKYFQATKAHFLSKKLEAEAVLDTYFNNSVGIGEHSELLVEVNQWVEKLASAEDSLGVLDRYEQRKYHT